MKGSVGLFSEPLTRPALPQFLNLTIGRSAIFIYFRNVVRCILKLFEAVKL